MTAASMGAHLLKEQQMSLMRKASRHVAGADFAQGHT